MRGVIALVVLSVNLPLNLPLKIKTLENQMITRVFAEKEGFEPPVLLQTTVFKTAAFDHSAISPNSYPFTLADANIKPFFVFLKLLLKFLLLFLNKIYELIFVT